MDLLKWVQGEYTFEDLDSILILSIKLGKLHIEARPGQIKGNAGLFIGGRG